jgi:hypothetical protein
MMTAEIQQKLKESVSSLPHKCEVIYKLTKGNGLPYKQVVEPLCLLVKQLKLK